jgi:hypothetical protein
MDGNEHGPPRKPVFKSKRGKKRKARCIDHFLSRRLVQGLREKPPRRFTEGEMHAASSIAALGITE